MGYYDIRHVGSHVVIVDQYGQFVSSADTFSEAMEDVCILRKEFYYAFSLFDCSGHYL